MIILALVVSGIFLYYYFIPPNLVVQEWNSHVKLINRQVNILTEEEEFLFWLYPEIMIQNRGIGFAKNVKVLFVVEGGQIEGDYKKVYFIGTIEPKKSQIVSASFSTGWLPKDSTFPTYKIKAIISYDEGQDVVVIIYLTPSI